MTNIVYSDGTPAVGFTLDRLGRQRIITDATGTRSFSYNDALQLAAETNAFGVLVRAYDGLGRSAGFSLFNPENPVNPVQSNSYGYNSLGRFQSVTSSVQSVSSVVNYSYLPNSDLISGWSNGILSTVKNYEPHRDLISAVENQAGASLISRFGYVNDAIGMRTQRIDSGSATATNVFGYNPRSELTSARMGTNAYGYTYDPIGNRTAATNNAEALTYAANALNQYTNILRVSAPPREDIPAYDLDGNLTNYNGWSFAWDGENRLIGSTKGTTVVSNQYDYLSRRVQKIFGSTTNTFLYDGWAMIQETTGTQTNSYVYGLDLSGSMQGAGTIGGILSASLNGTQVFYFYDANGNVSDLTVTNGTSLAHYEYSPFGEVLRETGPEAAENPWRFSTRYTDTETGLVIYPKRPYSPNLGRWLSRDRIGEKGGLNLYG